MILYVPLIPTCEPVLNFFWIRPWWDGRID